MGSETVRGEIPLAGDERSPTMTMRGRRGAPAGSAVVPRSHAFLAKALLAAGLAATLALPSQAAETPRRGGVLTYMIPADAPPSLDGHRETTYATVHSVAPFYSVLIRVDPDNPADTTHFVCDLCTGDPEADRRRQDLHVQHPRGREVP